MWRQGTLAQLQPDRYEAIPAIGHGTLRNKRRYARPLVAITSYPAVAKKSRRAQK